MCVHVHVCVCVCKCYLNELPSFPLVDTLSLLAIEEERDALDRSPLAFLGALTPGTIFLERERERNDMGTIKIESYMYIYCTCTVKQIHNWNYCGMHVHVHLHLYVHNVHVCPLLSHLLYIKREFLSNGVLELK